MTFEIETTAMLYGPQAVGRLPEGKTVFVEGGAPQETVRIAITEDKGSFARAEIAEILESSPFRIKPKSLWDGAGNTAPWQHLTYECQLESKRNNVVNALVHNAGFDKIRAQDLVQDCLPSKRTWNYRNKLELGCARDNAGRLVVGFHQEENEEVLQTERSLLAHKAIEGAPKALQGALRYLSGNDDLGIYRIGVRHSMATGELEVALWTAPGPFPRAAAAKTLTDALNATSVARVLAKPGKARDVRGVEALHGRGYWRERLGEFEFSTQAPSFFQVNTAQAGHLVDTAMSLLSEALTGADVDPQNESPLEGFYIADLYAGGGTFSIALAAAGADVVAVEAAGSSVRDLRYNAELNDVDLEIIGGDAVRELAEIEDLDAVVVDPPRSGLGKNAIEAMKQASPRYLAYVSCNPATWSRDVKALEIEGFKLQRVIPVDMFPQTYHVEVVSLFANEGN